MPRPRPIPGALRGAAVTSAEARGGVGISGHSLRRATWVLRDGLPVAPPAAAWRQAAAVLTLDDLIIAADLLLGGPRQSGRRRPPLCTPAELQREIVAMAGSPGARNAAEAAASARVGVGSPTETRLRLAIVRGGLPEPVADHPVTVRGGRVWHPDLCYPEQWIAIEYEGDDHRTDRRRWRRDIARREAFEDAGWRVVRVTADDLADPRTLLARLTALLANRAELRSGSPDRAIRHDA